MQRWQEKHAQELAKGQLEINKTEAQHRSIFVVAGDLLLDGLCGVALAWHFVLAPFIVFFSAYFGVELQSLPTFDMESLLTVLMGIN